MMTPGIGIRPHVKIVFCIGEHDHSVKIATLEHRVKLNWAWVLGAHSFDPGFLLTFGAAEHLFLHLLIN